MTFAPRITFGSLDFTDAPFLLLPDRDMGSPETLADVVDSLLADGDVVVFNRSGNRTISLTVYIEDADSAALAEAERSLALEVGKNNELTVYPGDGFGEASVYDTFVGSMQHVVDDDAERAGLRRYDLSFPALPFAHPADPTTVTLTYGTATSGTTLDDGSSTTGWSVSGTGSTSQTLSTTTYLGEAALRCLSTRSLTGLETLHYDTFERENLALTAAHPYLAVDVAEDGPRGLRDVVVQMRPGASTGSFTALTAVSSEVLASGYRRYFFSHGSAGTTVDLRVTVLLASGYFSATTDSTYLGGVYSYASAPAAGLMIVPVDGSQRAPFSLQLSRAGGDLGRAFVFADPTMLEFGWNPGTAATWPNAPAGTYTVAGPTGTAGSTYALTINGQTSTTYAATTGEQLWFEFNLGNTRTGRLGPQTISYTVNGSPTTTPTLRYFRNADDTSLVALSNVAHPNLFIDSPTLDANFLGLWGGGNADGSDAVSLTNLATCADSLVLVPPMMPLYIYTSGTSAVVTSTATYYSRHHTFVAAPARETL